MEVGGTNENCPPVCDNKNRLYAFSGYMNEVEGNHPIIVHTEICVRYFRRKVQTTDRPDKKPNAIYDSDETIPDETSCRYSPTLLNEESTTVYPNGTEVKILSDSSASINLKGNNHELVDFTDSKPNSISHGTPLSVSSHVPEASSDCVMSKRLGKTKFPELKWNKIVPKCAQEQTELLEELRLRSLKLCKIFLNPKTRFSKSSECPFFDFDIIREDLGRKCSSDVPFHYDWKNVLVKRRLLGLKWRETLLKQKARLIQSSVEHPTALQKSSPPEFGRVLELPEKLYSSELPNISLADSSSWNSPVESIEKSSLEPKELLTPQKPGEFNEFSLLINSEDIKDNQLSNASRDTNLEEFTSRHLTKPEDEYERCSDATSEIQSGHYFLQSPVKSTEGYKDSSRALLSECFEGDPKQTLAKFQDSEDEHSPDTSTETCSEVYDGVDASNTSSEPGFEKFLVQSSPKYVEDYEDKCSLDASKTLLEECLTRCREQLAEDSEHASDFSETHLGTFSLYCPPHSGKSVEDDDEYSSKKFLIYLEHCPLNLSENSENEYPTETSSEIDFKEFPPQSPRNLAEDYENEYALHVAPEISLEKYYPQSLTVLSDSYEDEFSYDASSEISSADTPPRWHIKTSDYKELSPKTNFSHSFSVSITESTYCDDEESSLALSETSFDSISEMRQPEVSAYFSVAEYMDTSLSKDVLGESTNLLSDDSKEIHITENKLDTYLTDLERNHSGKCVMDDTELYSSSDNEGLYLSCSISPEKRMQERLTLDDASKPSTVESPCCETMVKKNFVATATKTTLHYYPGDKIYEFSPFVSVLNVEKFGTHCSCCFKRMVNKIVCGYCLLVCYCSEKCQVLEKAPKIYGRSNC